MLIDRTRRSAADRQPRSRWCPLTMRGAPADAAPPSPADHAAAAGRKRIDGVAAVHDGAAHRRQRDVPQRVARGGSPASPIGATRPRRTRSRAGKPSSGSGRFTGRFERPTHRGRSRRDHEPPSTGPGAPDPARVAIDRPRTRAIVLSPRRRSGPALTPGDAPVAELVDALDSKSSSARSAGSIPARGTKDPPTSSRGSWQVRAVSVLVDAAGECRDLVRDPGSGHAGSPSSCRARRTSTSAHACRRVAARSDLSASRAGQAAGRSSSQARGWGTRSTDVLIAGPIGCRDGVPAGPAAARRSGRIRNHHRFRWCIRRRGPFSRDRAASVPPDLPARCEPPTCRPLVQPGAGW